MTRMRGVAIKAAGLFLSVNGVACSSPGRAASGDGIKLGVLEDLPGHYAGQSHFRAVRVAFRRDGREWRPYPSECDDQRCLKTISAEYPQSVTWTVVLSGKVLGQVKGRTPSDFGWYSDVGLQRLASAGPIPTVGQRSIKNAGYLGEPVFRSLVVSSGSYFADPDGWKPLPLSENAVRQLRLQFREKFPKAWNCKAPHENEPRPWHYADTDIRVSESYIAKTGWRLAELRLTGYECDSPADDPFVSHWFVISPKGQVRYLDAGLNFLDAGDYDRSGKSAVMFSIDRNNRGGYELFYDDFRRRAVFQFSYH